MALTFPMILETTLTDTTGALSTLLASCLSLFSFYPGTFSFIEIVSIVMPRNSSCWVGRVQLLKGSTALVLSPLYLNVLNGLSMTHGVKNSLKSIEDKLNCKALVPVEWLWLLGYFLFWKFGPFGQKVFWPWDWYPGVNRALPPL